MDQFIPIYNVECLLCEHAPVVGINTPAGRVASTGFCGPHFFGDGGMIDEDEWNRPKEATE